LGWQSLKPGQSRFIFWLLTPCPLCSCFARLGDTVIGIELSKTRIYRYGAIINIHPGHIPSYLRHTEVFRWDHRPLWSNISAVLQCGANLQAGLENTWYYDKHGRALLHIHEISPTLGTGLMSLLLPEVIDRILPGEESLCRVNFNSRATDGELTR
jgi:hypothetical protein